MYRFALIAVVVWIGSSGSASAATTAKVLATDPPGTTVTLGQNQNFYLRISYTTDEPVSIWARPYYVT